MYSQPDHPQRTPPSFISASTHSSKNNRGIIPTPSVDNPPRPPPQSNHYPSDADKRRAQSHIIAQQRPGAELNVPLRIHNLACSRTQARRHAHPDSLVSFFLSQIIMGGQARHPAISEIGKREAKREGKGWAELGGGRKESGGEPSPSARGKLG
jgi:hypothetical protein